ncbi:hypothetical protein [Streptomyces sp. NPDC052701]|uniref:hypothetical protein n=1 Tax=Streptomyces sp. NPDC052701 TaxID=3155533 RepID=UPI0034212E07
MHALGEHLAVDEARPGQEAHRGPVSTSCVGFGVERWLHALADHFGGDWAPAQEAVEKAGTSPA